MKLDLHNHTSASPDSVTKPETFLKKAIKLDLVLAVTDHDNIGSWDNLKAMGAEAKERVIYGEEILTTKNGKPAGELLALFMNEFIPPGEYGEVIDQIRDQGALLVVPHPFDTIRRNFKYLNEIKSKIDLVETFNSHSFLDAANKKAKEFAEKHNLPRCAGSDSHTPENIGLAYAEVEAETLEEARKQLLMGNAKVHGKTATLSAHAKTFLSRHNAIKPR